MLKRVPGVTKMVGDSSFVVDEDFTLNVFEEDSEGESSVKSQQQHNYLKRRKIELTGIDSAGVKNTFDVIAFLNSDSESAEDDEDYTTIENGHDVALKSDKHGNKKGKKRLKLSKNGHTKINSSSIKDNEFENIVPKNVIWPHLLDHTYCEIIEDRCDVTPTLEINSSECSLRIDEKIEVIPKLSTEGEKNRLQKDEGVANKSKNSEKTPENSTVDPNESTNVRLKPFKLPYNPEVIALRRKAREATYPYFCAICGNNQYSLRSYIRHLDSHMIQGLKLKVTSTSTFGKKEGDSVTENRQSLAGLDTDDFIVKAKELIEKGLLKQPYFCQICDHRFVTSASYLSHLDLHKSKALTSQHIKSSETVTVYLKKAKESVKNGTTKRPYLCMLCNYKSPLSQPYIAHLNRHLRTLSNCPVQIQTQDKIDSANGRMEGQMEERVVEKEIDLEIREVGEDRPIDSSNGRMEATEECVVEKEVDSKIMEVGEDRPESENNSQKKMDLETTEEEDCQKPTTETGRKFHVATVTKVQKGGLNGGVERDYNCQVCSFKTTRPRAMITHLNLHMKKREQYVCPAYETCKYSTFYKRLLNCHMRKCKEQYSPVFKILEKQKDVRTYICTLCSETSEDMGIIKDHISRAHPVFHCDKCDFQSRKSQAIKKHKRWHGIEPVRRKFLALRTLDEMEEHEKTYTAK